MNNTVPNLSPDVPFPLSVKALSLGSADNQRAIDWLSGTSKTHLRRPIAFLAGLRTALSQVHDTQPFAKRPSADLMPQLNLP